MPESDEIRITRALVWTWIVRDGRCVVVRNERPDGSSWWSLPGGGVEPGETLAEGARREAREETGLCVRLGELVRLRDRVAADGRWLMAEFAADAVGGSFGGTADPTGKIREVRWAGPAEVGELLGGGGRAFLEELLRRPPRRGAPIYREERVQP